MSVNEYKGIRITLKLKSNGTTTQDIYLSDRPVLNDTNTGRWIPILESATVGQVLSDYVPQDGSGTIIINNEMSTFAEQLRFSDWLEDYAIIGQPVKFYIANNAIGTDNFTSGLVEVWNDVIQSYTASDKTITLTLKSNVLPQRVITYEVDANIIPSAPASSIGKNLPLVFGGAGLSGGLDLVDCQAIPFGEIVGSNYLRYFGYATVFSTASAGVFTMGAIEKYYSRNIKGEYSEFKDANLNDYLYQWGADSPSNDYLEAHEGEFASRINYDSSNPYLAVGCRVKFRGNTANTAVTFSGEITVRLYERRADTGKPRKQSIAEASVNKADYEVSLETNSEFFINFTFPEPVLMDWANGYFLSVSASDLEANGTVRIVTQDESGYRIQYRNHPDRRSTTAWKRGDDASGVDKETDKTFVMSFYCVTIILDPTGLSSFINDKGLSPAAFSLSSALETGTSEGFDLDKLDIVVRTRGLTDSTAGAITGTASYPLNSLSFICILLDYEWSGSAWTRANKFDHTFQSTTHNQTLDPASAYYRRIAGKTNGRTRIDQLLQELCRQTQSRVCFVGGTARKWGLYVIGASITASDTLYDDDFKTVNVSATESGAIVNDALILYDQRIVDVEVGPWSTYGINQKQNDDFAGTVHLFYDDGGSGETIAEESFLIYGQRELSNNKFNFIVDPTSATNIAKIILSTHDQPFEFITIELPYYENRTLKAMDTLNIRTPKLWDLDGTTHNNNFNPLAKTNTFTNNSGTTIRAKSYKVQIINYQLVFDKNSIALYRLTCKLLTSANDPT